MEALQYFYNILDIPVFYFYSRGTQTYCFEGWLHRLDRIYYRRALGTGLTPQIDVLSKTAQPRGQSDNHVPSHQNAILHP